MVDPASTTTLPAPSPFVRAVGAAVAEAKDGDPLAPVTVVVPSTLAGLSLRRLLAAAGHGVANVRFSGAPQLAEQLAAGRLAADGRQRSSVAVQAEAVRAVLRADPGWFRAVADHPATERVLERGFAELRGCTSADLDRLAEQSPRAAEVVRLHRAARAALHGWYDDVDLLEEAQRAVAAGDAVVAEAGPVVFVAPRPGDRFTEALVRAYGERAQLVPAPEVDGPAAHRILSAVDADDEVRAVAREVLALARDGVPLHRMAVAHPGGRYPLVVHQQFQAAGIAHNGPGVRSLAQTVPGATLLGALGLVDHDFRRDDVMGWIAAAPIRDPRSGRLVEGTPWDARSREAAVVAGPEQWSERLDRYHARLAEEAREAAKDPDGEHRAARSERRQAEVLALRDFVAGLVADVDDPGRTTWHDHVAWARSLLDRYLGREGHHGTWPEADRQAWDEILAILDRLAGLDRLGVPADLPTFRRALERDLARPAVRLGPFGDGLLVAPIRTLRAVDLDVVFVVGLAEGVLPAPRRDDGLLPDRERNAVGAALGRTDPIAEQHDDLRAALASARRRVLTCPRTDLERGRQLLPSRWLVDAAGELAQRMVFATDLDELAADPAVPGIEQIESFAAGVREGAPASLLDHDLGRLSRWRDRGGAAIDHPLAAEVPRLGAGLRALADRDSDRFTAADGRVDPAAVPQLAGDRPLSPTSLQEYATCPRRYFLDKVLHVAPAERPEDVDQIRATDRGSLVHAVLEDYVRAVIDGGPRTLDALLAIAEEHFVAIERRGLTGRPLRWAYDRGVMRRELREVHALDDGEPVSVEMAFGLEDETPVEIRLDDGRALRFKGYADRVDRLPDGQLRVTDYKTGSTFGYDRLAETFVDRGTRLQLPLYALAARDRHGQAGDVVHADYWFVSERARYERHGYEVTPEVEAIFRETVQVIADGIAAGAFPARPGAAKDWPPPGTWTNCEYCDYDDLCPTDRADQWDRKRGDPLLAPYVRLAEGPEPTDEDEP